MRILVTILIFSIAVSGCQFFHEQSIRELKDLTIARETAKNYQQLLAFQIGFTEGGLGESIKQLPAQTVTAIAEAKEFSTRDPNDMTDYELGYSLGLRARILCSLTREIISRYAPELLRYMPE